MATDPNWCFENYGEAAQLIDELEQQRDVLADALKNVADNVCERMIERGPVIEGTNFHALQVGIRAALAKVTP